jgi:hypothetical protein
VIDPPQPGPGGPATPSPSGAPGQPAASVAIPAFRLRARQVKVQKVLRRNARSLRLTVRNLPARTRVRASVTVPAKARAKTKTGRRNRATAVRPVTLGRAKTVASKPRTRLTIAFSRKGRRGLRRAPGRVATLRVAATPPGMAQAVVALPVRLRR